MYIVLAAALLAIEFYLSAPQRAAHILLFSESRVSELRISMVVSMGNAWERQTPFPLLKICWNAIAN